MSEISQSDSFHSSSSMWVIFLITAFKRCCMLSFSVMSDFVTLWTVASTPPPPPDSSVHVIFQARILECIAIFLLQGIFPIQGSKLHLLCLQHWKRIVYPLSHQGSPYRILINISIHNGETGFSLFARWSMIELESLESPL